MYRYEIYLTGGHDIGGEIEDPDALYHLMNTGDGAKLVKLTDNEGVMVFKPEHIQGVSYWQEKAKGKPGFMDE